MSILGIKSSLPYASGPDEHLDMHQKIILYCSTTSGEASSKMDLNDACWSTTSHKTF
jgi:hypothetical protein